MSNAIKAAISATVEAVKIELATGKVSPELQQLTQKAIEAAEKAVGSNTDNTHTRAQTRPRRPR